MAQDKRQENQPETPMETQPELQPVDALRDSRRKLTRSIVVTVVLAAVAALAVFEGITLGWLSNPNRNVDANETDIQSASVTEQDGHDTYKFDVNQDKGVCINDDAAVTMNAYDKELPKRNERTPIILRAVLSSSHSTSEKLSLMITCASKELKQETLTADTAEQYNSQLSKPDWKAGDKINWLSNVVNVRAGYIPGLQTRAVAGNYAPYTAGDTTTYKDADDYIYNYAVDFFRASTAITPVKFVTPGSTTTPDPTSESSQHSRSISANQIGTLPEKAPETNPDGSTKTYTYKIDYYTIDYGGNVLNQDDTDHVEFEEAPGGYKLKYGGKYLSYNATYSNGWLNDVKLSIADNPDNAAIWTVTGDAGNVRISCRIQDYFWNSTYYLSFSGNVWSLRENPGNSGKLTITQYYTETVTTTFPEVSVGDEKNLIINVDLAGAKEPDDGRYYVYLMFDYDHELVNKYLTDNGISLKLGSENIPFTDAFQITVVETPTT